MPITDDLDRMRRNRALVEELIDDPGRQRVAFQPIADLGSGEVVAYRSRLMGQAGSGLETTADLLEACTGTGLLERLDWAGRVHALAQVRELGLTKPLHITPEPVTYGTACPPRLAASFGQSRRDLSLAAEIPLAAFADETSLLRGVEEYRAWGWRIVADDVADSPSALDLLDRVRPDWLRLDFDLPGRTAATPKPGVRRMLSWAADHGAVVMAHAIDTAERRTVAAELGATVGRGRAIGHPGPLPAS